MCFCVFSLFLSGCASKTGASGNHLRKGEVVFTKIAVVPFQRMISEDTSVKTVCCPLCGKIFGTCKSSKGAEKVVEKIFFRKLKECGQFVLVSTNRVEGIYERISIDSLKATPLAILREVGKEMGADGVVAGYVYCYGERKGYPYSVEKPASVAFGIHLIRVSDGALVWRGVFDRTQSSLLENILKVSSFLKQGGKWLTADELSEVGVNEVLKTFPGLQRGEN